MDKLSEIDIGWITNNLQFSLFERVKPKPKEVIFYLPLISKTKDFVMFFCPACAGIHTNEIDHIPKFDKVKPTICEDFVSPQTNCYFTIKNGMFHYSSESKHAYASKIFPMIEIMSDPNMYEGVLFFIKSFIELENRKLRKLA